MATKIFINISRYPAILKLAFIALIAKKMLMNVNTIYINPIKRIPSILPILMYCGKNIPNITNKKLNKVFIILFYLILNFDLLIIILSIFPCINIYPPL